MMPSLLDTYRGPLIAVIAVLVTACALASAPTARANSDAAPAWLRQAASEKVPDYPHRADDPPQVVLLLDEAQITAKDNGEIETRFRRAFRILRPEAQNNLEWSNIEVPFGKDQKVSDLRSWTITADGRELATSKNDVVQEGFLYDIEYTDAQAQTLKFLEPRVGSVVGYEYVFKNRPFMFEDDWYFQDTVPVHTSRVTLQLPSGWEFSANFFNMPDQKPANPSPGYYVWELHDFPAVDSEPQMPPWRSVAEWMGLKYFPRNPALRAKTTGTWQDIGLWYNGLILHQRDVTPEMQQKVAALTAGIPDTLGKMRAIADYMRGIRYFAVEIGIGGFQPHSAAEVFSRGWGDCKDKVTLLSAMLSQIGIDSYYTMVDTDRGIVRADYPSLEGNHMILAIRLPADLTDGSLAATVNDPKLGRLLFFDPTNEYVPLGNLPWYLQDSYGLVMAPDGGHIIKMPLLPPLANRILRQADLSLDASGNLIGQVDEVRWGTPASNEREQLHETVPAKRAQIFERFLGLSLGDFALGKASVGDLDNYDESLVLNYQFAAYGYAKTAGDLLIVRPRVLGVDSGFLDLFTGKNPRKYPVEFGDAIRLDDIFNIKLPAGYKPEELPSPVQADCLYASYKSDVTLNGDILRYQRTYELKDVDVPADNLSDLRSFFSKIADDERSSAILRRANQ
jgi:transglutaminase-like putative cysteine protease